VLTEAAHAFRGVLGAGIVLVGPADPEAKGLVERAKGYLETSFLPGRTFTSPADFNTQLNQWLGWSTIGSVACSAAPQSIGSRLTVPRCCGCRRSRR
jgi:hypothetical protein